MNTEGRGEKKNEDDANKLEKKKEEETKRQSVIHESKPSRTRWRFNRLVRMKCGSQSTKELLVRIMIRF